MRQLRKELIIQNNQLDKVKENILIRSFENCKIKIRKMNRHIILKNLIPVAIIVGLGMVASCTKSTGLTDHGPYIKAPNPPVKFLSGKPDPADAVSGDEVSFKVSGLDKLSSFSFYINQVQAEVLDVKDSLITVKVPQNVSSGAASVLTSDGQYFYGPILRIDGKISIDQTFNSGIGTNGDIRQIIPFSSTSTNLIMVGNFTDYNGNNASHPVNNIAQISINGGYQNVSAQKGAGGSINYITQITSSSQYLIGGSFGTYNDITGLSGLTRLNSNLSIDSMVVQLVNPDLDKHPENSQDTVATFNGGVSNSRGGNSIVKVFNDFNSNGKLIAIGNFDRYYDYYYPQSEKNTLLTDVTRMNNFIRFSSVGVLDSTYNFDPLQNQSYPGLNGYINDCIQLSNGKIIFVGSFTSFNGATANRIAALSSDGTMDASFGALIGAGADDDIYKITYNATTHKILVIGAFKNFEGHPANGIAMLNEDGSYDNAFSLKKIDGGVPNFAGQLNNGLILVSGTFQKYDSIIRQGFMILDAQGDLAAGYNNTGTFSGRINGLMETTSALGDPAVLLYGSFNLFDNSKVGNIVRIIIGQ